MRILLRTSYTIFATMCLGIVLLIPIINLFILKEVIRQETGVKIDFWKRPLWERFKGGENEED
jgi:hypothetical protein